MFNSTPKDFQTAYEVFFLWPFGNNLIFAMVARSTVRDYTIPGKKIELCCRLKFPPGIYSNPDKHFENLDRYILLIFYILSEKPPTQITLFSSSLFGCNGGHNIWLLQSWPVQGHWTLSFGPFFSWTLLKWSFWVIVLKYSKS